MGVILISSAFLFGTLQEDAPPRVSMTVELELNNLLRDFQSKPFYDLMIL